ncbi:MAG: hypothetical protein AAF810_25690 [Cyanobacteria bacterium P01_D01_bin.36]
MTPERLKAVQGLVTGWMTVAESELVPVSASLAQTVVNDWLLKVLPDRFTALDPHLIAGGDIWFISVGLSYPRLGVIGEVGEVLVSAFSQGIISATRPEVMKCAGMSCYKEQEEAIKTTLYSV